MMKKIGAIVLAIMMIAMVGVAWAATTLDTHGEQGVFSTKDTPTSQNKIFVLEKEIKAYNLDESTINAPTISYTYTISPVTVTAGTTITDSDKNGTIHDTGVTVTVPVKTGKTTTNNGTTYPLISNNGEVAWDASTTADVLNASPTGIKNVKDISIDFSKVVFDGAGVYRYSITESLTTGYTYDNTGVTQTSDTANGHTRYIDVYVRPTTPTPANKTKDDPEFWDIYGFTCFYNNGSIIEGNKTTNAVKTTGFVAGTTDGTTEVTADSYYTYNLTIEKTVEGDEYAKSTNHEYPFSVIFTNDSTITHDILLKTTINSATDFTHNAGTPTWSGVASIQHGGSIKYIGIPCGTDVQVYETNNVTGITYKVETFINGSSTATSTDTAVNWRTSGSATGIAQASSPASYESTAYTVDTTKNTNVNTANYYKISIKNTLLTISPTGYVTRFAPYALILVGGIVLLIIAKKHKKTTDED